MENQTMKCVDCAMKHLSAALSYGKEILTGHGKEGTPDHRPDFLGELLNAEHHLASVDDRLFLRLNVVRTKIQLNEVTPVPDDLDSIRMLWLDIESAEKTENSTEPVSPVKKDEFAAMRLDDLTVDILLDEHWDEEHIAFFKDLASRNCVNLGNIVTDYRHLTSKHVWIFPAYVFITRRLDMRDAFVPHSFVHRSRWQIMRTDNVKARLDKGEKVSDLWYDAEAGDRIPECYIEYDDVVVNVTRQPCCSVKKRLDTVPFVNVYKDGWPFMKEIWKAKYNL